jgi:hypothetical protein
MAADLLHRSGLDDLDYDEDLVAIAQENGSSAIDALDLVVVFHHGVEALYAGPKHSAHSGVARLQLGCSRTRARPRAQGLA